ncbi:MAG: hypothetical protein ACRDC9_07290 [Plesiomonas shigelloides]
MFLEKIAHSIGDKIGDIMLDREMYDIPRMSDDQIRDIICGRESVPAHIKASAIKEGFKRSLKD